MVIPKFDNVNDISKILYNSGFEDIKVHEESTDIVYRNKKEWWNEMNTNAVRGIFEQIEILGAEIYAQFKINIFNGLEYFKRYDGLHFNMPVIYIWK